MDAHTASDTGVDGGRSVDFDDHRERVAAELAAESAGPDAADW